MRQRPTVSVFSSHSAKSQASGDKENYLTANQKPYYSGEYSVPMTQSQVQKLKVKSSSVHSRSSHGGSRPLRVKDKSPQQAAEGKPAIDLHKAAQKITPAQMVRPFVAGTESSAERHGPETARVALEYFQTQVKTASMPKFFSPTQQKVQAKFSGIASEKQPSVVSQSVQAPPGFRKGLTNGKVSPAARRPPQSSRPSSRQSSCKHDQSVAKSSSVGASRECALCKGAISSGHNSISQNSDSRATVQHGSRKLLKRSDIQYAKK